MPGYPPATSTTPISDTRKTERNTQLGFAYTTPCLVTGGSHCNWLSFLITSSMSQFLASLASCTTVTAESVSSVLMAATSLSGVTLHYITMFRGHVTHNMFRPDLLLALSSQHHDRRARGLQPGHVQVSRLPLLRQGHHHAESAVPS